MMGQMARPRVILLVLVTGLPVLVLGQSELPSLGRSLVILLGTALCGAACSVFNAVVDKDRDARMERTRDRPLPAGEVTVAEAMGMGTFFTLVSTVLLVWSGGWLAAGVGLGTIAFYVGVYTVWLKPRTPQNIVIGGAAGAAAPLIVDAAVDGTLGAAGLVLFAIVFLWTPPHFWAIALYRKEEYRAGGYPMMPLVVGDRATRMQSLSYALTLIPVSLVPVALGWSTWFYGAVALAVGLWFTGWCFHSLRADDYEVDRRVFHVSLLYLFALYGALLVDAMALTFIA